MSPLPPHFVVFSQMKKIQVKIYFCYYIYVTTFYYLESFINLLLAFISPPHPNQYCNSLTNKKNMGQNLFLFSHICDYILEKNIYPQRKENLPNSCYQLLPPPSRVLVPLITIFLGIFNCHSGIYPVKHTQFLCFYIFVMNGSYSQRKTFTCVFYSTRTYFLNINQHQYQHNLYSN